MSFRIEAIAVASAVLFLVGCGDDDSSKSSSPADGDEPTAAEVAREASEAAGTAGDFAEAKVEAYVDEAKKGLASVNTSIDTLGQRIENMAGETKVEAQRTLEELRSQRDAYLRELDEASADSAQAWGDVKAGLDRAWADLKLATERAMGRFDADEDAGTAEGDDG